MAKHTEEELRQWQALPLDIKISMTCSRIRAWIREYGEDGVYISFSGGKDSTVLLDIVRNKCGYKNVRAMFIDVPTQYPELMAFAQTFDNVDIIKPRISFIQVCEKYGFPLISKEVAECVEGARKYLTSLYESEKILTDRQTDHILTSFVNSAELANILNDRMQNRKGGQNLRLARMLGWLTMDNQIKDNIPSEDRSIFSQEKYKFFLDADFEISNKCCKIMKKEPARSYEKDTGCKPMTAQMAAESRIRKQKWMQLGCNAFEAKNPISNPMAFWTENDVLQYIFEYLEKPLKNAWANINNKNRKKRRDSRKYLRKNNYRKNAICSVYGEVIPTSTQMSMADLGFDYIEEKTYQTTGCKRTGCMLCGFGCHLEKSPNRFEQLKKTHPGVYGLLDKVKNNGVTFREAIEWTNEHGNLDIKL